MDVEMRGVRLGLGILDKEGEVLALTMALEKQHTSAQRTIGELEEKVRSLEA